MEQRTTAQPMQRPTLQQMLATISPLMLDQTVGDAHLAGIATALANWRSVCTNLGISAAEEAAIEEENQTADTRRYVELIMMCVFAPICPCCSCSEWKPTGQVENAEVRKRKYGSEKKSRLSVPGSRMCLVAKG